MLTNQRSEGDNTSNARGGEANQSFASPPAISLPKGGGAIREVLVNTAEGMWTTVRNFLRPFRGVHKQCLSSYVAMCEFSINLKWITPAFISALVALH